MASAQSRLTSQGQISVLVEVRRKLGVGPGSILEWEQKGDEIVVRRAGRYGFEDMHRALFPKGAPELRTLDELREGIRDHVRMRYARH